MSKVIELQERRNKLVADCRSLLQANPDGFDAENEKRYDTMFADANNLKDQIERLVRQEQAEAEIAAVEARAAQTAATTEVPHAEGKYEEAFRHWLKTGERRAHQFDSNTTGGYTAAPEQFVAELIKFVDNAVVIRPLARKLTVSGAHSLGVPSLDTDIDDAEWTSELGVEEASDLAFGKRELHPSKLSKLVKVSKKLLSQSALNVESLVRDRLAYKFAIAEEKAFLTGNGVGQPLGLFTATSNGISTGRDVSTGNTTTAIKFDGLMEAKGTLKQQYRSSARWLFHRDAITKLSKEKDGAGNYIWRESTRVGEPDRILGLPVLESEYVPNTFTSTQYVGLLGDFSFYWIADSQMMEVQRLNELYAATGQIGFIGDAYVDAMPVLEEAFVRVKLG
jgi:HK97 family phage major capsid protein